MGLKKLGPDPRNRTSPSGRSGARSLCRPLFLASMLSLTALALGAGLSFHGNLKIPGLGSLRLVHVASAADVGPPQPVGPLPGRISGTSQPAPTPAGTDGTGPQPSPDLRATRALAARVHLQAGKASLWTDLRRLGASLV